MRILILNQSFHPDIVAVAQHAGDLAAALAADGHAVTVVASRRSYTNSKVCFSARETWRGCEIHRVTSLGLGKQGKWRRILDSLTLLVAFLWALIRLPRFDVVLAMTHPPLVAFLAALVTRVKGGRLVSWIMDLNPDEAIAAGWVSPDSWTAAVLNRVLCFSLRSSDRIILMDRFMQQRIRNKGIPANGLTVVPPWSHDDVVRYDPAGRSAFRKAHGLAKKFVVMYSGNLSIVHPIDTLLDAALQLRHHAEISFCFVGGGNALPKVRDFMSQHALRNISCLPYQPLAELGASLSAADLHAVVMGDDMVGIVHPCKIYNVLALGTPFLHVGPRRNHIADIIAALRTPGAAYDAVHGDVSAVVAAILDAASRRLGPLSELVEAAGSFSQRLLVPRMVRILADSARPAVAGVMPAGEPISGR